MSDISANPEENKSEERQIADLTRTSYGETIVVDCDPSDEEISEALKDSRRERRHFQNEEIATELSDRTRHLKEPIIKLLEEWGQIVKDYHAQRIAYLIHTECDDPIDVNQDGFITDGNHRVRAAMHRGLTEIKVRVAD